MMVSTCPPSKQQGFTQADITLKELQNLFENPLRIGLKADFFWNQGGKKRKELEARWKSAGGMLYFGSLIDGNRSLATLEERTALTLDCDEDLTDEDLKRIVGSLTDLGCNYVLHTTFKSRPQQPRARVILPLDEPWNCKGETFAGDFEAVTLAVAKKLDVKLDPCSYRPAQGMYKPVVMDGADYRVHSRIDGKNIRAADYLEIGKELKKEKASLNKNPTPPTTAIQTGPLSERTYRDPRTYKGIRGAFNRKYPQISQVIERFLSDVYEPTNDPNAFSLIAANSAKGLRIFNGGMSCRSFHTNKDKAANQGSVLDGYKLVCVHRFNGNEKAMKRWIVSERIVPSERYPHLLTTFPPDLVKSKAAKKDDKDGEQEEDAFDENFTIRPIVDSYAFILEADDRFNGMIGFDEFAQAISLLKEPTWRKLNPTYAVLLEHDVDEIYSIIEHDYDLRDERKLMKAFNKVARRHGYHPIREKIDPIIWDGRDRISTLFQDRLGAEDLDGYTAEVAKRWLVGAWMRLTQPGCKLDIVPCFTGGQGVGKTELLTRLSLGFYTDELCDFTAKDTTELLISKWLAIDEEGFALERGNVGASKRFFGKVVDNVRLPYKKRSEQYPRHVFFAIITNEAVFLKDLTGNRRFFPISCDPKRRKKAAWELSIEEVLQIWAQAKVLAESGVKPFFTSEEIQKFERIVDRHRDIQPEETEVIDLLVSGKFPPNWHRLSVAQRLDAMYDLKSCEELPEDWVPLDYTCPSEIWHILLGHKKHVITENDDRVERTDSYPVATSRVTQYLLKAGFEQDTQKTRGNGIAKGEFVGGDGPKTRDNDREYPGNYFWHRTSRTDEMAREAQEADKLTFEQLRKQYPTEKKITVEEIIDDSAFDLSDDDFDDSVFDLTDDPIFERYTS